MSNIRISQLPAVTTVAGSDLAPVVASGVTSKITIDNIANSLPTVPSSVSASYAATASSANDFLVRGDITGSNLLISNTITAQKLVVQYITSSTQLITGSTKTGTELTNTHQFTGSVTITGSLSINDSGVITSGSYIPFSSSISNRTSLLESTASVLTLASASFAVVSASYAQTSQSVNGLVLASASFALVSQSYVQTSESVNTLTIASASFALVSASYAQTSQSVNELILASASFALVSESYAQTSESISSRVYIIESKYLTTGSNAITGSQFISGSLIVTGSLESASITGSLKGTSSWADNVVSSSYPIAGSGSVIYSTAPAVGSNIIASSSIIIGYQAADNTSGDILFSNIFGDQAASASLNPEYSNILGHKAGAESYAFRNNLIGYQAGYKSYLQQSNVFGYQAGLNSSDFSNQTNKVNFIGYSAGANTTKIEESNLIGDYAGQYASYLSGSNFIGSYAGLYSKAGSANFIGVRAGNLAISASFSNFIGLYAGSQATNASQSNFLGYYAGAESQFADYSNIIGYQAGKKVFGNGIGRNNIIIGTNITLENDRRDSINLGGVIFATGSYYEISGNAFSGSAHGKVGINVVNPDYSLDVSGSANYRDGLIVTGSLLAPTITGSIFGSASFAITASYLLNAGGVSIYRAGVSQSSAYYVTHSLGDKYPIVQVYNAVDKQQLLPSIIESVSENHTYVEFVSTFSGSIIVMGSNA